MKTALQPFYESIEKLNVRGVGIEERRDKIHAHLRDFTARIKGLSAKDLESKNKDMSTFVANSLQAIQARIKQWDSFTQKQAKQEAFRDGLANKFIVVIYGKVKAGKSSLGNFVANIAKEFKQKPVFKRYDKTGEHKAQKLEVIEEENQGFKTNITECTSEIQLFELGGMAWVDTPGLLSMTKENEYLAKQYIDAADYILFPTSSDSPAQADELTQIKELVSQSKSECIQILITKSDESEEDDVNGEIVKILKNKDKARRAEQENDVKKRLEKLLLENSVPSVRTDNIFSISAKCAKSGLKNNDTTLFNESNMVHFYQIMQEIVEHKAQNLKNKSPYDTLVGFITTILEDKREGIEPIRDEFAKLKKHIEDKEKESERIFRRLQTEDVFIDECVNKADINTSNLKEKMESIQRTIEKELQNRVENATQEIIEGLELGFNEHLSLDTKVKYYKGRYKKDRVWWKKLPVISWFCDDEYGYKTTGNNLQKLITKNTKILKSHYKEALEKYQENIAKNLFAPCKDILQRLHTAIKQLETTLKEEKENLKKESK